MLPCFVLNRSHRFNHVSVCGELLFIKHLQCFLLSLGHLSVHFHNFVHLQLALPHFKTCPQTTRKSESSESSVPLDGHAYEN